MTTSLHSFKSLAALQQALANKSISATELAQESLANIKAHSHLNAFLHIDDQLTLTQARMADDMIRAGTATALTGIPIAHKDVFVTQ